MTPNEFVKKYFPFARDVEEETEIPAIAILAQAALESGWGRSAIGNNIFGIKYKKGDWKYQEVLTTEHSDRPDAFRGQKIKSVNYDKKLNKYVYKIWQYFADYPTPKEAFLAHSKLLLNDRYKHALEFKHSPKDYMVAVWKAGYATDANYDKKICAMIDSVVKRLPDQEREQIVMKRIEPKTAKVI